jgi:hypothetical protein
MTTPMSVRETRVRDVGSGDDGSGTGDETDGVTGPAVKLRDDDGAGYGANASSRLVSTSESAHDTEEEGKGEGR